MGRPRKNRVGEYAALLSEEVLRQFQESMSAEVDRALDEALVRIESLENQVRSLERKLDQATKAKIKEPLGRWVPGGPGRPPKEAEERVAAFRKRKRKKGP